MANGRDLVVIAGSVTSFTLTSTGGTVDTHTFAGKAAAISGTPVSGDTWTLSVTETGGGGSTTKTIRHRYDVDDDCGF